MRLYRTFGDDLTRAVLDSVGVAFPAIFFEILALVYPRLQFNWVKFPSPINRGCERGEVTGAAARQVSRMLIVRERADDRISRLEQKILLH